VESFTFTSWEPEALLRDSLSDESSGAATSASSTVDTVSLEAKARITAVLVHPTADFIFCGKDDGVVMLYSRRSYAIESTLWP